MKPLVDKQLILDSLAAIARGAGRPPSRTEFIMLSGISEHQVSQFFPTWNDAVRAAGLRAYTVNMRLKDRELLEDWAMAVRAKRKIPARRAPTGISANTTLLPFCVASTSGRSFTRSFAILRKANRNGPTSSRSCLRARQSLRRNPRQRLALSS